MYLNICKEIKGVLKMSLKVKIFLGFSVCVLIAFSVLSYYTFSETTKTIMEKEQEMLETISQSINIQMEKQLETAEVAALSLANNSYIQKLFGERNRSELAAILLPTYKNISSKISQVQFHLPDSSSFLRLHQPEKYGDSLKDFRFTVNEANEKKEMIKGLEKGVGGFGFRVVVPMFYNNKHTGSVEYGSDFGNEFLERIKEHYSGEYFIYQLEDGTTSISGLVASTIEEDKWQLEEGIHIEKLKNNEIVFLHSKDGNYNIVLMPFKDYQGNVSGYFKIINDRALLVNRIDGIKRNAIIFTIISLSILLLVVYGFLNYSLKPIKKLTNVAEQVSLGDLTQNVELRSKDEVSSLASTFNVMISSLRDIISQSAQVSEQVAATSQELSAASEEVTASSEQVANTIVEVTESAHNQAISIEKSNEIMQSMVDNIQNVSINIQNINKSARNTLDSAQSGIKSSKDAVDRINNLKSSTEQTSKEISKLNDSSKEIEKIVDTIGEIAEQTNLLALNAAIEAARAGEAGRGFSVVAEEVRKLAEQTSLSSSQISELILGIQNEIENTVKSMELNNKDVESSVKIVNESSNSFSYILNEIDLIASQIEDVSRLTQGVATSATEVTNTFNHMYDLSQKTVDSSEGAVHSSQQQIAAMEEIASSAMDLATMASDLRNTISRFKY